MNLEQCRVIITRPAHQAAGLVQAIEATHGIAYTCPSIEILPPPDRQDLVEKIQALDQADIAIFLSANAVLQTLPLLQQHWLQWPSNVKILAVGAATASILENYHLPLEMIPQNNFSSEGLLELPILQTVQNKTILLFRGTGGRTHLAEVLQQRGAQIQHAISYRRAQPNIDLTDAIAQWQHQGIDIIIYTSGEGLLNFYHMVAAYGTATTRWLQQTPLLVMSARLCEIAKNLGFSHAPIIAKQASDRGILTALQTWYAHRRTTK